MVDLVITAQLRTVRGGGVALLGWVSAGPRQSRKAGISTPRLEAQAATPAAPRSVSGVSCGSTEVNLMPSATTGRRRRG